MSYDDLKLRELILTLLDMYTLEEILDFLDIESYEAIEHLVQCSVIDVKDLEDLTV